MWNTTKKIPALIKVNRGLYSHYGVIVADDEVIHLTGLSSDSINNPDEIEVRKTNLDFFKKDGVIEYFYYDDVDKKVKEDEQIINDAYKYIGTKGYDLVKYNCEHFARFIVFNKKESKQVNNILSMLFGEL